MGKLKTPDGTNGTGGYEWEYAKKKDTRTTGQKIGNFIYNPRTHAVLGRTATSWGALLLFYAIFYSVLALLFTLCMKVLLSTLNKEYPKWQLQESIIGDNPGLGYRPMASNSEAGSIIWYNKSSKHQWITAMKEFVDKHYKEESDNLRDCSYGKVNLQKDEVCRVSLDSLGGCAPDYGYGFGVGKPCIFIKLNRIYGWMPDFYNEADLPSEIPENATKVIKDLMKKNESNYIWLSCNGQSPHDRDNLGSIDYFPAPGFPYYFYPYMNTKGYMSPLVAVRFTDPKPGVLINMECRAWAKNIHYKSNSQMREGSVHFELQVDEFR